MLWGKSILDMRRMMAVDIYNDNGRIVCDKPFFRLRIFSIYCKSFNTATKRIDAPIGVAAMSRSSHATRKASLQLFVIT